MVTIELDKHDLLSHIEGFARGSHLRQHIWENVVVEYMPQMIQEEKDYLWYYLRRDIWPHFFGGHIKFGAEYFLQAMAALHKNNYYNVYLNRPSLNGARRAYMFQNRLYPEYGFRSFYNDDFIQKVEKIECKENVNVPKEDMHWWNNTDIYNLSAIDVLQFEKSLKQLER